MRWKRFHFIPFIVVATKSDKLNKTEFASQKEALTELLMPYEGVELYPFSALKGEGTEAIEEEIKQRL